MGIYLTDAELEVLDRAEGCLVKSYVFLRTRMDRRTGLVGSVTGISHQAVAEHSEYEIKKGAGVQVVRLAPTPKQAKEAARRICERLVGLGLLVSVGGPVLCFLCALADYGQVRPNQTGRERATPLSTERATPHEAGKPANTGLAGALWVERASPPEGAKVPNGPHIKDQGVYTPQSSSTTGRGVAPGDGAAAGVNRDRAAPSQAGSLGRTGETHDDPYRDRPVGSHVGPWGADSNASDRDRAPPSHPARWRRLATGPDAGGALPGGQGPINARSSAEKESFADDMTAPAAAVPLLRAVLDARGIRVAPGEASVVADWASVGVSPDEVADAVERARAARIKAGSTQPIPLAYVVQVLSSQRAAAKRAAARLEGAAPRAWRGGFSDLAALARQLGIAQARPGEEPADFRARVMTAYQAHKAGGHGQG